MSCRGKSGRMSRRTDAGLCATEVIHLCKTCSSAVGFHQGVQCGLIGVSIAIVGGIPVVSRIVVVLLVSSLGSSQQCQFPSRALSNHSHTVAKAVALQYNSLNYGNKKGKSTNYSFYIKHKLY